MEAEILLEIRNSEKKSDEIIERAKREKEAMMHEATINSSKLLTEKEEEIRKTQEKKLMDFREKAKLIRDEKLAEGKNAAKQLKAKSEKNIPKAVESATKKFEEIV
ncbi:hypothetical protein HYX00_06105 [Candidatus Woesearchaeota archaeon]|nr:hypothetical protein [Candidatus Woesearchaeota archaeon]